MNCLESLKSISGVTVLAKENLKKYHSLGLHGFGSVALLHSEEAVSNTIKLLNDEKYAYEVLGFGSNLVIKPTENFIYLKTQLPIGDDLITPEKSHFLLPANYSLTKLTSLAKKWGFVGWDVFTGIPASVGGAVWMNAGTRLGEFGELVESVSGVKKDGGPFFHKINFKKDFSYRKNHFLEIGDIITYVTLRNLGLCEKIPGKIQDYLEYRNISQPLRFKTCGCVFKNPSPQIPAGKLIELVGLKGLSFSSFSVSHTHGNFIINKGEGTYSEFKNFIEKIKNEIELHSGIRLKEEVIIY